MTTRSRLLASMLFLASHYVAGCAAQTTDETTPAPSAESTAEGALEIETRTDSRVAGRFTKDGTKIAFDFSNDEAGTHIRVLTAAAAPLVESLIRADGSHITKVLGERLVVESSLGESPIYTGDRAAEDTLRDMPEAACLGGLEPALIAAKIDPALLPLKASPTKSEAGGIKPNAFYGSPYAVYYSCGSWTPPRAQTLCGSNFLGYTNLVELNCSSQYAMVVFDGVMEYVPPAQNGVCGSRNHGGWWWGMNVPMVNMSNVGIYYGH